MKLPATIVIAAVIASPTLAQEPPAAAPGSVLSGVAIGAICKPGYARRTREAAGDADIWRQRKASIARRDGVSPSDLGRYELDHRIPICLGGDPIDPRNEWMQPWEDARWKDKAEAAMCKAVCNGRVSLPDAQAYFFGTDWAK